MNYKAIFQYHISGVGDVAATVNVEAESPVDASGKIEAVLQRLMDSANVLGAQDPAWADPSKATSNTSYFAAGLSCVAQGVAAVAIGDHAEAIADGALALGKDARATGPGDVAIGSSLVLKPDGTVRVHSRGEWHDAQLDELQTMVVFELQAAVRAMVATPEQQQAWRDLVKDSEAMHESPVKLARDHAARIRQAPATEYTQTCGLHGPYPITSSGCPGCAALDANQAISTSRDEFIRALGVVLEMYDADQVKLYPRVAAAGELRKFEAIERPDVAAARKLYASVVPKRP